jgi:hypothetical protein
MKTTNTLILPGLPAALAALAAAGCSVIYENNPRKNDPPSARYAAHAAQHSDAPNNSRQNVPTYSPPPAAPAPQAPRPNAEAQHADGMRAALRAQKEQEAAQVRAAEDKKRQEREAKRAEERAAAVASGVCKAGDPEACNKILDIRTYVGEACATLDEIAASKAEAAREIKDAKKFGVVNLELLQSHKERAQLLEDTLADRKETIRTMRGKPFNKSECRN